MRVHLFLPKRFGNTQLEPFFLRESEVLTLILAAEKSSLQIVLGCKTVDILNHNMETVARLSDHARATTPAITLSCCEMPKEISPRTKPKLGIMLGAR